MIRILPRHRRAKLALRPGNLETSFTSSSNGVMLRRMSTRKSPTATATKKTPAAGAKKPAGLGMKKPARKAKAAA